jgi:ribose transport system permease protein
MKKYRDKLEALGWTILNQYTMLIILLLLIIVFSQLSPAFLSKMNLRNLIVQNSHILVLTVGLSFIMMSGAIDLSIGYQISLISTVVAMILIKGMNPILAVSAGIGIGITCGLMNASIGIALHIPAFVVTIASQNVFKGISYIISSGQNYTIPADFRVLTKGSVIGVTFDVWLAILAVLLAGFVFQYTYFGRYVKSMGSNEESTRLAGVNTKLIRVLTFAICGLFAAVAAFIVISKQGITSPTTGIGLEFTGMTAAILGGVSFNRGEGKMWGLVVGVFVLAIIENGMQLAGWNQYIQYIIKGAIMLSAVGLNNFQQKAQIKSERKKLKTDAETVKNA